MIPAITDITDDGCFAVVRLDGCPWVVEIKDGFGSALHNKPRLSRSEARRFIWTKAHTDKAKGQQ